MKLLYCHNFYQKPGGEDVVFAAETELLRDHGHQVIQYTKHNDDIAGMSKLQLAKNTVWNKTSYNELRSLIKTERPDLMHCANTFPLISPAAYDAAHDEGIPVVQTLHNFRIHCPKAQFLRDGNVCESCLGKRVAWPAIVHRCYRDSRTASAVVTAMLAYHHQRRTWHDKVDHYIALTQFGRDKFVEGGLPAERISVKPNFVSPDPGPGSGGDYAIFVGRLSPEKGITSLLSAWQRPDVPLKLKIVGDGPLASEVKAAASKHTQIEWLGRVEQTEIAPLVSKAALLVMPSIWYETFGLTIVEAFACGTPVVASRLGAMSELITDGVNGELFSPGDATDLLRAVQQLSSTCTQLREAARHEFEQKYTAERNYEMLKDIYQHVLNGPSVSTTSQPHEFADATS